MLSIRPANLYDAPFLWELMEKHQDKFLDDFSEITKQALIDAIEASWVVVLVDHLDIPVAGVLLDDYKPDTNIKVHMLFDAKDLRRIKPGIPSLLDFLFQQFKVKVLYAEVMETQRSTIAWLERLGFQALIPALRNRTRKNNKAIDAYLFQLTEGRWKRIKHDPNYKPKRVVQLKRKAKQ